MKEHYSTLSLTWARSLLELANEAGQTEAVANDIGGLQQVLEENPGLQAFLKDPGISREERDGLLSKVFQGQVNPLVERWLRLMSERGRLAKLQDTLDAFEHLLDEQLGKVEVDVTVAERLSEEELEEVRRRVSQALKKDAVIHQYVDGEIIGGMILRVGDQVVDASVRRQLEAMKQRLLRGA